MTRGENRNLLNMEELGVVCGGAMTEEARKNLASLATAWRIIGHSEGATICYFATDHEDYDERVAIIKSVYASDLNTLVGNTK